MYDGHLVLDDVGVAGSGEMGILIVGTAEVWVEECNDVVSVVHERQAWREGLTRSDVFAFEVPPPLVVPPAADTAVGCDKLARYVINRDGIPFGLRFHPKIVLEVSSSKEHTGGIASVTGILQLYEERQISELAHVFVEVGHRAVFVELLEDNMSHRHAQCRVGTLLGCHPYVSEL